MSTVALAPANTDCADVNAVHMYCETYGDSRCGGSNG